MRCKRHAHALCTRRTGARHNLATRATMRSLLTLWRVPSKDSGGRYGRIGGRERSERVRVSLATSLTPPLHSKVGLHGATPHAHRRSCQDAGNRTEDACFALPSAAQALLECARPRFTTPVHKAGTGFQGSDVCPWGVVKCQMGAAKRATRLDISAARPNAVRPPPFIDG